MRTAWPIRAYLFSGLLMWVVLCAGVRAERSFQATQSGGAISPKLTEHGLPGGDASSNGIGSGASAAAGSVARKPLQKLIVIGFMGGKVSADNLVHPEARLIKTLKESYPGSIHAMAFANRDGAMALRSILQALDEDGDHHLSDGEKSAARIVIYGHSWGASETVALADRLNKLGIPVLLTIQVDSVEKPNQNDVKIPPNVREAVNFYQSEGLLHGRNRIVAVDPERTRILGNHELSYRKNPVSCAGYPWYARAFMKRHIQLENDPAVWSQIQAMILERVQ